MAASNSRLRITVLSPLAPRKAFATTGAPPLRAFVPDGVGIDGLLSQIPVGVKIEVSDPFGASGAKLRVDLSFTGPKSFRPAGIVAQVPALRALAEVPARLRTLAGRKASRSEIVRDLAQLLPSAAWAKALAPTATPADAAAPSTTGSSSIDDILSHTQQAEPAKSSAFSSLISQIARGSSSVGAASRGGAEDRAMRAFGSILSDILDHPEVRRLERTWRSVRYLLDAATSTGSIDVELIPIDDQNLPEALTYLVERPVEILSPPDLLVLDTEISLTEAGLGALELPALVASQLRAPLVVGARIDDHFDNEETPALLAAAGAAEWAPWVVLAVNGGLMRGPYTEEKLGVPFSQEPTAPGARVFASAPWLVAALVARAFRHDGWPGRITGPEAGMLSGFDVHGVVAGGATAMFATEKLVTVEGAQRQARRGICALTSVPNRDTIACIAAPTLAAAAGERAPTLADQLFVARIAGIVDRLGEAIPAGTDPASVERVVQIALAEIFPQNGSSVPLVETKVANDKLEVTITPRRFAGTTMGEISFEAPFGG